MNRIIQIAYSDSDKKIVNKVIKELEINYKLQRIIENPISDDVILAMFTKQTEESQFLSSLPWLKKEREFSSISHLKVMPFFIYDSKVDDPEKIFESKTGELYENIFSGEFKPFGWDINSLDHKEFIRVLAEYSE